METTTYNSKNSLSSKDVLRVIHTGDLHVGQTLQKQCRLEEHRRFFQWLRDEILRLEAHVLLIAGDLFDKAQPRPDAQRVFFDFLADLQNIETLQQIVITAGNHDSAAQLEAYKKLFSTLDIHIVGADSNMGTNVNEDWVVPLYHPSQKSSEGGAPVAVVSAVPFILEYRLGLHRYNSEINSQVDLEKAFKKALQTLYRDLADMAEAKYPGSKLLAMGHLTALPENDEKITEMIEVHRILKEKLTGDVFDERYRYVALGHIHKNYRVRDGSNAWYCGSPMPCSIDEAEDGCTRSIFCIDIPVQDDCLPNITDLSEPEPEPEPEKSSTNQKHSSFFYAPKKIMVPKFRHLFRLKGEKKDMFAQLESLAEERKNISANQAEHSAIIESSRHQTIQNDIDPNENSQNITNQEDELDMFLWIEAIVDAYDYDVLQQIRKKIHELQLPIIVVQYTQKFRNYYRCDDANQQEGNQEEVNQQESNQEESNQQENSKHPNGIFEDAVLSAPGSIYEQKQSILQSSLSSFLQSNTNLGQLGAFLQEHSISLETFLSSDKSPEEVQPSDIQNPNHITNALIQQQIQKFRQLQKDKNSSISQLFERFLELHERPDPEKILLLLLIEAVNDHDAFLYEQSTKQPDSTKTTESKIHQEPIQNTSTDTKIVEGQNQEVVETKEDQNG